MRPPEVSKVVSNNTLQNENYGVKLEERDDTTAAAPELSGRGRLGGKSCSRAQIIAAAVH